MSSDNDAPRAPFARVVKQARDRHDWSQQDLADHSGIGERTIARWEKHGGEPYIAQIRALIDATGIPAEDVLRALGLLPPEEEPRDDLDPEEQAIWDLGVRRNWPEEMRWEFIDLYQLRKAREGRTGRRSVAEVQAELAALQEEEERGTHRSSA